ncbi:helix-turn-helix transcriptional regulator [Chryseobacterium nepalense]|uniref:helix-turn-helix domain-containing protein n=1 Tax=Chryseobacterium nepalense TaxID=1854498 RepID=UPI002E01575F|nr:transcriptional regulator with XRE-family HTH domain [Chryseobacterium nepalense]
MNSFGKKLRECREAKNLSQKDLARLLNTSYSVIGNYERDEMIPSIEVAKNIAKILGTTVGYLLGETEEVNIFKNPAMLNRFNDIEKLDPENKKTFALRCRWVYSGS